MVTCSLCSSGAPCAIHRPTKAFDRDLTPEQCRELIERWADLSDAITKAWFNTPLAPPCIKCGAPLSVLNHVCPKG